MDVSMLDQGYQDITLTGIYKSISEGESVISHPEGILSVGPQKIQHAKKFIDDNFAGSQIIYGDTDSVFIRCAQNGEKLDDLDAIVKSIERYIVDSIGLKPHTLEYEETIYPVIHSGLHHRSSLAQLRSSPDSDSDSDSDSGLDDSSSECRSALKNDVYL